MKMREHTQTNQYDKLLRLQNIIEDNEFTNALRWLDNTDEIEPGLFDAITGVFQDVATRYGASPEELDTAIELTRATYASEA